TAGSGSLESSGLQSGEFAAGQAFASSQSQSVAGAIATSGSMVAERTSTGGLDDNLISGLAAAMTVAFSIEVDGGNVVAVSYTQATATSTDFTSLSNYLTGLESQINAALTTDGQSGSVRVFTNTDNQLVIESNSKGTTSSIEISAVETANDALEITALGITNNANAFGSSGAVSTQGVLTSTGAIEGSSLGQVFSTALLGVAGTVLAETLRISVDGGATIDAEIALATMSDAVAALAYVETEINEDLAAAGQSGRVSLALNTEGFVTITSDLVGSNSSVEILANNTATATFSNMAGLQDYMKSATAVDTVTMPNGLDSGDLVLNGVAIETAKAADDQASNTTALSSSKQASGIATAAAINRVADQTGINATVNTTTLSGGVQVATTPASTAQTGSIFINGVETATITTNGANGGADDRAATISAINAISGQTGVAAVDDGKGITLNAADGRNISVVINNNEKSARESGGTLAALTGAALGLNVVEADISGGATFAATAQTTYSTVTLDGPGTIDVQAGANGAAALEELGFRVGEYGSSEAGTRLSDLDISTVAGAELAIKALDNAIGSVATQRADLGAIQNRLDSTVNNLSLTSINLQAANSRIQDADFASETAELSRSQVLQQAGISILAQANAAPQQVLSLLG
ncbi:MAG: flagellin, partial [Bermanella sp.]